MHTPRQTHTATNCQYCVTLAQQTKSTAEPNAPRIIGARAPWRSHHLPVGMAVTAATTRLTESAIEISADYQPRSSVLGLLNLFKLYFTFPHIIFFLSSFCNPRVPHFSFFLF